mmetsp:Transcript_42551/g.70217  ORF Transcript_42551/g.70217 Transcript_42551/m.70217 type:complete len:213 (+) Transcript_42551:556-1194(+)
MTIYCVCCIPLHFIAWHLLHLLHSFIRFGAARFTAQHKHRNHHPNKQRNHGTNAIKIIRSVGVATFLRVRRGQFLFRHSLAFKNRLQLIGSTLHRRIRRVINAMCAGDCLRRRRIDITRQFRRPPCITKRVIILDACNTFSGTRKRAKYRVHRRIKIRLVCIHHKCQINIGKLALGRDMHRLKHIVKFVRDKWDAQQWCAVVKRTQCVLTQR